MSATVKILSTVGLGLIAGYSFASPIELIPTIYSLSTRKTAPGLTSSQLLSNRVISIGSLAISTALMGTWALAGPQGRHPYLIYVSGVAASIVASAQLVVVPQIKAIEGMVSEGEDVNGEELAREFEGLVRAGYLSSFLSLFAFGLSVVGIYGDYK